MPALVGSLVPGHDAVINFAAETHVDRSISGAAPFVATNVAGVQVLLQACLEAGTGPVVQVSTDEVYGSVASGSWTEQAPLAPSSPYSAAKAGGDLMAGAYARTHGLDVRITRCCNNYGPYQYPEKVIPLFVTSLLDGQRVPLYGDGGNVRGWIHVDDHCRGIQLVLERGRPGQAYHINGDAELTNTELTAALLECCGAGWDMVTRVPDRKGHDRRYSLDDARLRAHGIRAAGPVRPGPGGHGALVRGQPRLVGTAHTAGRGRRRGRIRAAAVTRWLVTGAGGMLGTDLVAALTGRGEPVTGLDRAGLDVTDAAAVADAVTRGQPEVVINCAAWTGVDAAEAAGEQALAVNAGGAANLAAACAAAGARLVQVSTDYVFAGDAARPYAEDDVPAPRTAYGRTKLAGEQAVLDRLPGAGYVVRTAWLYGAYGPSFVATMITLEDQRPAVDVVDDQHGQPTWTADVAGQIIALVRAGAPPGIYHATSSGQTTWFGLAREVFRLLGADPARVRPIPGSALPRPAPRPAYSVLGHDAWARLAVPRSASGAPPCIAPSPTSSPPSGPPRRRPDNRPDTGFRASAPWRSLPR